ncbi:SDR family oxidoreductase [Salinicola halophyticus]|uniref:SDR family oxidoreductase n=1 Tax=Salinicola halophyticus TaxID=1808881 RepID=UPI003F44ADAD
MSKVFIVGAAGQVGRRLIGQLTQQGHEAIALHRKPEQAEELKGLGGQPVAGDIQALNTAQLASLMQGSDAVVFTAGAGGAGRELTNAIDGKGLELSVDAARQANVKRFLLVSAFPEAMRSRSPSQGFENYMAVKKSSDAYLAASDLNWVILRPGTLTDTQGTGKVRADLAITYGNVSRDDVAATLAKLIDTPAVTRSIIELTEGETPIDAALQRLARA